ncbi:GTP 3',8-cyclase MoaA [Pelotomaculum isophthalicicum JI]|uniref:GTP 3',8-cyclase n=1 Tax=Pelotomaculum isophthalicicum JI TaxID=947010 RepID=A0A9X4H2U9_9FIRM|nr:GTP 3',8-cyclase MoaA [Pelotomaculum isophthalicicum]MDF9409171.1 GTP 3',8-cyclase MoaA [Pelotomaculum isophthalicicum JI]
MQDNYQREINYLRISVIDRCNLRCVYCMPPEGVKFVDHKEILRFEEIEIVVRAAASIGVKKVRLTGGEPLVRKGLENLIRRISNIPGIDDIALTTNGLLLPPHVQVLQDAGLKRVNISFDTLDSERYRELTRFGELSGAWEGIVAALDAGFHPVKLNTVVIRGFNDDEVVDIARLTLKKPLHIRFIEFMPIGSSNAWATGRFVPAEEIMSLIKNKLGPLIPAKIPAGSGPAKYYRLKGAQGTVGFITSMSEHFCSSCNRLRLTSTGSLRPCLYDSCEVDLKAPLRNGAGIKEIAALIKKAVSLKADQHHMLDGWQDNRVMSQIGG